MSNEQPHAQIADLFAIHEKAIYRFVFSMLPNRADADDVVQETLVQLWENVDKYDVSRPFLPWAFRFAYRQVLMHRRRQDSHRQYLTDDVIEAIAEESSPEASSEDVRLVALGDCMGQLNDDESQIVRNRYEGEQTLAELANEMGQTSNTLYKRLQRIRERLVNCVQRKLSAGEKS